MRIRIGGMLVATVLVAMSVGCTPKEQVAAPVIEDKVFPVTPVSVQVKAGILTGEMLEMKITERVEKGSGRIDSPPKFTGTLKLKNISADQTVRLIGGKILYIDAQGQTIKLEDNRTAPTLKVASGYSSSSSERLDPGQASSQAVDAEFPVEALKAKTLKEIRLELSYVPTPFKEEKLNFSVSIGG
ncbi:MAG: hypothetical protein A3G80_06560 [Betaproteobacteria bacterium RIFCSPLOWO2_12_FULL_62_13b]|nr:MAG: hypothetical protein A3G80_06560 [Betaproteobacteria bacterium RIFCSPLOWO2_12_FULL_62_13b]